MTQTWKLMAVGATAAAALALAIGTASARAAKVIIIRDGTVDLESRPGATVLAKPPNRFKHRTNIVANRVRVLHGPEGDPCQQEERSLPFAAPNALQVLVIVPTSDPNDQDPVALFFNVENHREPNVPHVRTGLSFGRKWRFQARPGPGGPLWRLVDSQANDVDNFEIGEIRLYPDPINNPGQFDVLASKSGTAQKLCVEIIEEDESEQAAPAAR
jgi:hypothetical protein